MSLIQLKNIVKQYSGHTALDDVSFDVPKQGIFGLLGPNGAGKTSLIRILTQITMPDSGEVLFAGNKLKKDHIRKIGYLPEERGLYKKMMVREQLIYLARLKDLSLNEAREKVDYWLARLKLTDWSKKYITDLSKGMQQKVQFIATVIHEPELIILDEPFSGFDPVNAELIRDEILQLRDQGATILLSTHRMESVEEMCDSIALINKAKLVLTGSIDEVKNNYRSGKVRLKAKGNPKDIGVKKVKVVNDVFDTELDLNNGQTVNELIQNLIKKVEIISIEEKEPTIRDIFFKHVQES